MERWQEEVVLLEEEMRRTEVTIKWEQSEWEGRAAQCRMDTQIGRGKAAYALRQAADRAWMAHACHEEFAAYL